MALTKVQTSGIADDAVTTDKLANAINTERTANTAKVSLGADSVTGAKIADDAIDSEHITDGSIDTAHIADNQITLAKMAGGTDGQIITYDASGDPVAVGPGTDGQVLTSTGAGSPPAFETISTTDTKSFRNLIINGAMQVAQYSTPNTTTGYVCDRWYAYWGGQDEALTMTQHALTSGDTGPWALGFRNSLHIQNGNNTGGAGTNDGVRVYYRFEGQDLMTSGWDYTSASSYITLSFWVKASVAQNYYVQLKTEDGTDQNYAFETGSLSANTWTKITKTIPGNSNIEFVNDATQGMEIVFWIFSGTEKTGSISLNTWAAYSSSVRIPDMTSTWWTTDDATFEITGVQLEVGDTATDFEHKSYADELLRCYRYYYAHKGMLWGITSAGDHLDLNMTFPLPMRTTPSRTQVDTSLLFKNRLEQENSTSATTYNYSGAISPTGDFWVARPGSGDAWGINYTTTDTHAVYWHPHEGTTSYAWSCEL